MDLDAAPGVLNAARTAVAADCVLGYALLIAEKAGEAPTLLESP